LLEDSITNSKWRLVTGEASAGKLKRRHLLEIACTKITLKE
jgi:hypothetical protein